MRFVFLVIALLLCEGASARQKPGERFKIGTVGQELNMNGGCALQLPRQYAKHEGNYVFTSDFDRHGLVNVNGVDTPVALVKSKEPHPKGDPEVGERSTYWYAGDGIEVQVDYRVTEACPAKSKPCDVTNYEAILTVKRGKRARRQQRKLSAGS